MALFAPDSTHSGLVEARDEAIRSPDSISELDYQKINKAIRVARKAGQPEPKWIRIGDHTFNIEYVKKAMRTLSTKRADGYYRSERGPLVVKDKTPSITWLLLCIAQIHDVGLNLTKQIISFRLLKTWKFLKGEVIYQIEKVPAQCSQ